MHDTSTLFGGVGFETFWFAQNVRFVKASVLSTVRVAMTPDELEFTDPSTSVDAARVNNPCVTFAVTGVLFAVFVEGKKPLQVRNVVAVFPRHVIVRPLIVRVGSLISVGIADTLIVMLGELPLVELLELKVGVVANGPWARANGIVPV